MDKLSYIKSCHFNFILSGESYVLIIPCKLFLDDLTPYFTILLIPESICYDNVSTIVKNSFALLYLSVSVREQ